MTPGQRVQWIALSPHRSISATAGSVASYVAGRSLCGNPNGNLFAWITGAAFKGRASTVGGKR